jgi:hypothetical protein
MESDKFGAIVNMSIVRVHYCHQGSGVVERQKGDRLNYEK